MKAGLALMWGFSTTMAVQAATVSVAVLPDLAEPKVIVVRGHGDLCPFDSHEFIASHVDGILKVYGRKLDYCGGGRYVERFNARLRCVGTMPCTHPARRVEIRFATDSTCTIPAEGQSVPECLQTSPTTAYDGPAGLSEYYAHPAAQSVYRRFRGGQAQGLFSITRDAGKVRLTWARTDGQNVILAGADASFASLRDLANDEEYFIAQTHPIGPTLYFPDGTAQPLPLQTVDGTVPDRFDLVSNAEGTDPRLISGHFVVLDPESPVRGFSLASCVRFFDTSTFREVECPIFSSDSSNSATGLLSCRYAAAPDGGYQTHCTLVIHGRTDSVSMQMDDASFGYDVWYGPPKPDAQGRMRREGFAMRVSHHWER